MKNIKSLGFKIIATAIFGLMLSGCSMSTPVTTVGSFEGINNTETDKGVVFIYRESSFAGSANQYDVMVDGVLKGSVPNGSFFNVNLNPGKHKIEPKTFTSFGLGKGIDITVEKGKSYCLKLTLNFCVQCKSADLNIVDNKQCEKEIKSLDKVQLKETNKTE